MTLEVNTSGVYGLEAQSFEERMIVTDGKVINPQYIEQVGKTSHSLVANQKAEACLPYAVIKGKDKEGNEINDSINWNFIITCLQVEMKKLRNRIIALEA